MSATRQPAEPLTSILNRVEVVAEQIVDRFPLFADPASGHWTTSRRGAWAGGFWAGLWWLRVAVLGRDEQQVARAWTARLAPRAGDDTATRGMTFWYGAGSGYRLTGDPVAAEAAALGRSALVAAFDGGQQLVPFGSAFDAPDRPAPGARAPHAGLSDPTSPVDTSAAAIAAAALLTLSATGGPGAAEYHAAAVGTVEHLVERHLRADGVLSDGCYDHTRGLAPAHELVWGSYFLAATLAVLSGRVDDTPW